MSPDHYTLSLERPLLSLVLQGGEFLGRASRLEPSDFTDRRHQLLFATAVGLAMAGRDPDAVSVGWELDRIGRLADAGGADYIGALAGDRGADPRRFAWLLDTVAQLAARRRVAAALAIQQVRVLDPRVPMDDPLDLAVAAIAEAARVSSGDAFEPLGGMAEQLIAQFESGDADPGLPTGIGPLDELIQGGLKPGDVAVIAGPTGGGKTSIAMQIALGAASAASRSPQKFGAVLVYSLEMSREELYIRMISQVAPVRDGYHRPRGWLPEDLPLAVAGTRDIAKVPLIVVKAPPRTVEGIRASVELYRVAHGRPALVIVDHVGLLPVPGQKDRIQAVGHITRSLKAMAVDVGLPVIALAQLNREIGKRDHHRPQLSDLRESGSLEQDANVILFVHSDVFFLDPKARREIEAGGAEAEIIVAKNRNGETGSVPVTWLARRCLFIPDPAWRPQYGTSIADGPPLISYPAPRNGIEERLVEIVAERQRHSGRPASRAAFYAAYDLTSHPKWADWPHAAVVERLVAQGKLRSRRDGSGATAPYEYCLPGTAFDVVSPSPRLTVLEGGVSEPTKAADHNNPDLKTIFG